MAIYKQRKGSNLTASLNISYGGKSMVKSLSRTYQEITEIKKTVGAGDTGVQVCAFNTGVAFLAGTQKDAKLLQNGCEVNAKCTGGCKVVAK